MPSPMLFMSSSNMEYNYFTDAPAQPFQMYPYGTDLSGLPSNVDVSTAQFNLDELGAAALLQPDLTQKFDESFTYDSSLLSMHGSPGDSLAMLHRGSIDSTFSLDLETEVQGREGSTEDRDPVTPAQSRRKAQNRAAQRAFRERKERHVRDLENKLDRLTNTATALKSDNDRLKMLLQKVQTENEQLRASAATHVVQPLRQQTTRTSSSRSGSSPEHASSGMSASSMTACTPPTPQLLTATATWDYLQAHPRYKSGTIDIAKVCEQLKKLVQNHGSAPVFDRDDVRRIIEEVESNSTDVLL